MLDSTTKRRIDDCRDILVGKVPDPKSQIEQITVALIYKFMHDMDQQAVGLGGKATFFAKHTMKVKEDGEEKEVTVDYAQYAWPQLSAEDLSGEDRVKLYGAALESMEENPGLPSLFRDIFKNAYLPYRDPATLREFLKRINEFSYDHSEKLGDAFEYLLSIMGSQGDAGQFRTPRHLIDFMTAILDPKKTETILDPACGTAGFLISAYKHILRENSSNHAADDLLAFQQHGMKLDELTLSAKQYSGDRITPDQRKKLVKNLVGYDISPDMVRLSLVNLYLHGFPDPHIYEYDTLTSDERWEDRFDVILANPPFMSPKGGIQPHGKFGIPSKRSEVLFVDYIAEHLNPNGRAMVVVPEGIIFQSGKAYKALRKKLVDEHYLVGVVSVPGGVFNPYSGVKTSLLWFDRALARKTDKLLFVKVEADGFDLGAQRRPIAQNDLPEAFALMLDYKKTLADSAKWEAPMGWESKAMHVERSLVAAKDDYVLSGDRYATAVGAYSGELELVPLGDLCQIQSGAPFKSELFNTEEGFPLIRIRDIKPNKTATKYTGEYEKEFVVNNDDLLIGMDGEFNATLWDGGPALLNQRVCRLHSFTRVKKEYVYLLVQKKLKEIEDATYAVTVKHISVKQIKAIEIPLPPLAEQEALVAEVEGYQQVIDGARQVLAHYRPRITIDPAWPMVELGEVCDFTRGPFGGSLKKEIFVSEGYAVYEQGHAIYDQFDDVRYFITPEKFAEMKRFTVHPGDVIMSCSGTMGKVAIVPDHVRPGIINQALLKLVPHSSLMKEYLKHWMDSDNFQEILGRLTMGAAIQNVASVSVLKNLLIALPDISTQQRIVAELEEERRLVEANKALVERMEAKVRERVARVWGLGSARPDTTADRTIGGLPEITSATQARSGNGRVEYPEQTELPIAAEPVATAADMAQPKRGPGRPPKGSTAVADESGPVILAYLAAHPGWFAKSAIVEATGVDVANWNAAIKGLLEAGKVERQGEKKGARYRAM